MLGVLKVVSSWYIACVQLGPKQPLSDVTVVHHVLIAVQSLRQLAASTVAGIPLSIANNVALHFACQDVPDACVKERLMVGMLLTSTIEVGVQLDQKWLRPGYS